MEPKVVIMTWRKSTKHTEVFESTDPSAVITTLYVSKIAFYLRGKPNTIKVTVEDA